MTSKTRYAPYTSLDFSTIDRQAQHLANVIRGRLASLTDILLKYESHEVARDEIVRTLDLLENLKENKGYFRLRVGAVTAFLPRNQPLYALSCFVLVPSFMAREVHFRIPHSMQGFFPELLAVLDIPALFPNVVVSSQPRLEFVRERSALLVNPKTGENRPLTDAVIFTGTSGHADQLRGVFDTRTLFITNGAGHNPVVVARDADLPAAVRAVLTLQFYNQGQDCAAPNAILVHRKILPKFLSMLRDSVRATPVGRYRDVSCRIGPISDSGDLVRIQDFLVRHREWLDPATPGIIRAADAIVEPTIICKPLVEGGNFGEIFAPITCIQEYTDDAELALYFEDPQYAQNAMYVTVYGTSAYVQALVGRPIGGKVLHDRPSLLHNVHLHAPGIERGTQPYGGNGRGASGISVNGKTTPMPTLPQRDIYEQIAKPILRKKTARTEAAAFRRCTSIRRKDVEKLLRLRPRTESSPQQAVRLSPYAHIDSHAVRTSGLRYAKVPESSLCRLLDRPNAGYAAAMEPKRRDAIRALQHLLNKKLSLPFDDFCVALYALPKRGHATAEQNRTSQRRFFEDVYQLLFGKPSGPRLPLFLWEMPEDEISKLLDA